MKEQDVGLIYRFLNNELSGAEVELFKEKYRNDPEFKKEANLMSKISISLDAADRVSKKVVTERPFLWRFLKLRSAEAEESPEAHNRQILFRYAAIIIPLLALGTVLVLTLRPGKGYEDLYAAYFRIPEEVVVKGISEEHPKDFSLLFEKTDTEIEDWNRFLEIHLETRIVLPLGYIAWKVIGSMKPYLHFTGYLIPKSKMSGPQVNGILDYAF